MQVLHKRQRSSQTNHNGTNRRRSYTNGSGHHKLTTMAPTDAGPTQMAAVITNWPQWHQQSQVLHKRQRSSQTNNNGTNRRRSYTNGSGHHKLTTMAPTDAGPTQTAAVITNWPQWHQQTQVLHRCERWSATMDRFALKATKSDF